MPSMRATVKRRYWLPGRPWTVGLRRLRRWTKSRASSTTFCDTCVVDSTVATQRMKSTGDTAWRASGRSGDDGDAGGLDSAIELRSSVDSNQKKHVIWRGPVSLGGLLPGLGLEVGVRVEGQWKGSGRRGRRGVEGGVDWGANLRSKLGQVGL